VGVKNRPFPLTRHIAYTTTCISSAQAVTWPKQQTATLATSRLSHKV